jgi:hypothetical protein
MRRVCAGGEWSWSSFCTPQVHASIAGPKPRGVIIFRLTDFGCILSTWGVWAQPHSLQPSKLKCDHAWGSKQPRIACWNIVKKANRVEKNCLFVSFEKTSLHNGIFFLICRTFIFCGKIMFIFLKKWYKIIIQ